MSILTTPSHTLLFFTFVFTGIFYAVSVASGALKPVIYAPIAGTNSYRMTPAYISIAVLVVVVWGLVFVKKTVALTYFANGLSALKAENSQLAEKDFTRAISFDKSDIYWQAKAESIITKVSKLAGTLDENTPASKRDPVVKQINEALNEGIVDAHNARAYDPGNYYNYISEARVSEAAANLHFDKAYENAVDSYNLALKLNPYSPSIYLALARLQASQNKLDDALRSAGTALQVKNNYLDAVFLLSQIYGAKGDLPNAITAANIASQLNPQNPLLLFQLGLFKYNNKDYSGGATALAQAVKIQPDYANAKYFLGLAEARLGHTENAVSQFSDLATTNPDNREIQLIVSNLRAGKPIFADAVPPETTAPEKRATLPVKEKR
jgi:tetratricopeptide (TPR) repeat protein